MDRTTRRFGYRFALASFFAAAGYSIVQLLQVAGVLGWPWDDALIFGFSFLIAWPFMLAMLALHRLTPHRDQLWSGAGLLFAVLYAGYATLVYAVQLGTAMPLKLAGTPDPVLAMDRHSLFWAVDGMAYICMGLATLSASYALRRGSWVRRFFLANGLFTAVIAVIYLWPHFSLGLLLFGTPWIVLAPGSLLLLAHHFHRLHFLAANSH